MKCETKCGELVNNPHIFTWKIFNENIEYDYDNLNRNLQEMSEHI